MEQGVTVDSMGIQREHLRQSKRGLKFVAGRSILKTYLRWLAKITHGRQSDFYKWVLKNGRGFSQLKRIDDEKIRALVKKYRYTTKVKQCFYNSQMATLESGGKIKYFEGWYVSKDVPIPIEHGFNVINGKVIDYTSFKRFVVNEYFGVEIPLEFIAKNIYVTGMAEQMLHKYYIYKTPKLSWG